jgi:transposase-like protein
MKQTRRKFTATFKTQVVLEALRERQTLSELAQKFDLHQNQITAWKKEFLDKAEQVFDRKKDDSWQKEQEREDMLKQIGEMKMENEWMKKKFHKYL